MTDNYKIPAEIKALLTEDFYKAMWDELANVFKGATVGIDPFGFPNVEGFTGTCGWHDAFDKCAPKEAIDCYDKLDWWDGDLFDAEIGEELAKRFAKRTHADRIRTMTDEELAEFLWSIGASPFNGAVYINGKPIFSTADGNKWLDWLRQEAT